MMSVEGEVVGVLQALNKMDGTPFSPDDEDLLSALGGQAAAAVSNALLHQEIEQLFEGFVRASVVAIEARDPTTAGHSSRVAGLSVALADLVPRAEGTAGRWKGFTPSSQARQELRYAALLHDFGKVGVRENVLVKANKLEPLELESLKQRFDSILLESELTAERKKVRLIGERPNEYAQVISEVDEEMAKRKLELRDEFEFIVSCNRPTILPEGSFDRLGVISKASYASPYAGSRRPFLSDNEVLKLSVRKGSLTEEERREIESHVTHTFRFLAQIPWTRTLKRVPNIAYGHHEKLSGRGYPRSLGDPEIAPETRMMTISDIYDALTASDRPYKSRPQGEGVRHPQRRSEAGRRRRRFPAGLHRGRRSGQSGNIRRRAARYVRSNQAGRRVRPADRSVFRGASFSSAAASSPVSRSRAPAARSSRRGRRCAGGSVSPRPKRPSRSRSRKPSSMSPACPRPPRSICWVTSMKGSAACTPPLASSFAPVFARSNIRR